MTPAPDAEVELGEIVIQVGLFGPFYCLATISRKDSDGLVHTTDEWITEDEYNQWKESHK